MRKKNNKSKKDASKQILELLKKLAQEMRDIGLSGEIFIANPNTPEGKIFEEYISLRKKVLEEYFALKPKERERLCQNLFSPKTSHFKKKASLILLANDNSPDSRAIIERFWKRAKGKFRIWAKIAKEESSLASEIRQNKEAMVKIKDIASFSKNVPKISPAQFLKRAPFLFCDRRCDKCSWNHQCPVYKELLFLRIERIIRGERYESGEQFFQDIKLSFERAQEKINRYFLKLGINIEELVPNEPNQPRPEDFRLWRRGHQLAKEVLSLLELIFSQ